MEKEKIQILGIHRINFDKKHFFINVLIKNKDRVKAETLVISPRKCLQLLKLLSFCVNRFKNTTSLLAFQETLLSYFQDDNEYKEVEIE